jgi:hypothetical protein
MTTIQITAITLAWLSLSLYYVKDFPNDSKYKPFFIIDHIVCGLLMWTGLALLLILIPLIELGRRITKQ